jgi:alkylation response protein AidB-like acyl-CoA dehydrogenase
MNRLSRLAVSEDPTDDRFGYVTHLDQLISEQLAPRVTAIDLEGEYPETFLRAYGHAGGFGGVVATINGGHGQGIEHTIRSMARVGEWCLSTAFAIWCQTACARYIELSDNPVAKQRWLPDLATGRRLGGTGLSNTFKSACAIEKFLLKAKRVEGGYEINGTLPWVSNLGEDHLFVTGCPVEDDGRLVFFVVQCNQPGFRLLEGAHFTALEGTGTFACQFKGVLIEDAAVLAHPESSATYLARIQPGMILAQLGMGIGLIRDCIRLIQNAGKTHAHINCHERTQAEHLDEALNDAEAEIFRLARVLDSGPKPSELPAILTEVLKIRLKGGELSLEAAQAAMLHLGARGYVRTSPAQRRLREAYFVAIVTPSLKHLRQEIAKRQQWV